MTGPNQVNDVYRAGWGPSKEQYYQASYEEYEPAFDYEDVA